MSKITPHDLFPSRIADRIVVNDCWLWQGATTGDGYASFSYESERVYGHRLSYELAVGPIPRGLHIHHHCKVRHCINPEHLEAMTQAENNAHSPKPIVLATHCNRGHEFTPENIYAYKGKRHCRACRRLEQNERRARERAALGGGR